MLEIIFPQNFEGINPLPSMSEFWWRSPKLFCSWYFEVTYFSFSSQISSWYFKISQWCALLWTYFSPACWALSKHFQSGNTCSLVLENFCELFYWWFPHPTLFLFFLDKMPIFQMWDFLDRSLKQRIFSLLFSIFVFLTYFLRQTLTFIFHLFY